LWQPANDAPQASLTSSTPLDWKRAHKELVELSHKHAELDAEIGRWLLYAERAATPAWLGYSSVREYAEHLFGFTARQTQERLRIAEALEELPMLRVALELGERPWSVVRELTRVATPQTESEWLKAAHNRTARQVEQMVRGHRPGDHPGDPRDAQLIPKVLRFELSPEVYATVQEALGKVRRDAGERIDDEHALLLMARQVLTGPRDEGRSSYQIAISMCPNCRRGFQQARGELVELSREALDTACCDAQHISDLDSDHDDIDSDHGDLDSDHGDLDSDHGDLDSDHGDLDSDHDVAAAPAVADEAPAENSTHVGMPLPAIEPAIREKPTQARASQSIPPRTRRLVMRRAGGRCEVPGCTHDLFLDVHHCDLRSEGGSDDPNRLIAMCGAHHGAVHSGRLIIHGDARSGWQVRHADGTSYGRKASAHRTEACAKVFEALRRLGFKESECRKALDQVRRDWQTHVGAAGGADADFTVEQWLRAALGVLTPAPRRARKRALGRCDASSKSRGARGGADTDFTVEQRLRTGSVC
jgi:hypothetical protein